MTNTTATTHDCEKQANEHFATTQKPYRFLDSGLKNVYLVGVKYWICPECGCQAAEIPAAEQLMNVIAESIAMKQSLLSGAEIKFLRKRVGKKASDFAQLINKTPEHFSKLETEALDLQPATDKLIRFIYANPEWGWGIAGDNSQTSRGMAEINRSQEKRTENSDQKARERLDSHGCINTRHLCSSN